MSTFPKPHPRAAPGPKATASAGARRIATLPGQSTPAPQESIHVTDVRTEPAAPDQDTAGPFRLEKILGRGAEATVYRATDTRTGEPAAVKAFHKAHTGNTPRREVLIHSQIRHKSITAMTGHGEPSENPAGSEYLVMELVEGKNLGDVLRSGPTNPHLTTSWLSHMLKALAHLHARSIVHHDIKPSNILIPHTPDGRPTGHAKLTDFGVATSTTVPCTSSAYGTAHYMSPEQAAGAQTGQPGDIYSLGLVAMEILTGTRPFPGSAVESMLARTLSPPRIPNTLGRRWARLIAAMTAVDPADRLTARQALRLLRRVHPPGWQA
jgi:eukaryotic-like serine/threonine-protein kinase